MLSGAIQPKFGTAGSGDGQFNNPQGVAVDGSGNVYVADTYNNRVQKFSSSGVFLSKWGTQGSEDGQFKGPYGVAVDGSGNVYVADYGNGRVQKFSSSGVFLSKWGTQGSGDGQFNYPYGVAVDGSGNVYVADTYNSRVQKFSSSGVFLSKWGTYGSGDGQFSHPYGVAVDSLGNVYVSEQGNSRVQKFSSSGVFLSKCGTQGSEDGQFEGPYGVAFDGSGNVYVVDTGNHRVQKFSSSGVFLSKWGTYGSGDGQFSYPYGVAVDSAGNVYVAGTSNHRVQKFSSSGAYQLNLGADYSTWVEYLILRVVGFAAFGGAFTILCALTFNSIKKKLRRNRANKLMAKAHEHKKKNEPLETSEFYAKAYSAAIKVRGLKEAKEALQQYITIAKPLAINTALGENQTQKATLLDRVNKTCASLTERISIRQTGKTPAQEGTNELNEIESLAYLISKCQSNDLDYITDEAFKTPEIEHVFLGALHGLDEVLVVDLASKLGYSVDATFKLLSKSINLKKVEGYITNDCKKFVSKEYVQKQLTTHLK